MFLSKSKFFSKSTVLAAACSCFRFILDLWELRLFTDRAGIAVVGHMDFPVCSSTTFATASRSAGSSADRSNSSTGIPSVR